MIKIEGVRALLYEQENPVIREADIYIEEDKILKIIPCDGEKHEEPRQKPDRIINGRHRLAIPGLINSHTHAYMTLFRNMADDVPFTTWLFDTVMPLEDEMTAEDEYYGALLGNIEMIKSGTTGYIDMDLFVGRSAEAAAESGMRAMLSRGLVGEDRNDEGGLRRLREAKEQIERFAGNELVSFMLAPHAPYSCGPDYLRFVCDEAHELGLGVNIHLAEGTTEINNLREQYHMTPVEYALKGGAFDGRCVAAHCVYLEDSDFDILRDKGVHVAVNPVSNLKLANGVSNVPEMLKRGVNVCLGTDGAASNNTLNMFREMAFESLLHKGLNHDAIGVTAAQVIKMATLGGAAAMGMEGKLGALKEGYKADITILDLQNPELTPYNNLVSALCYSCNGSEPDTVIVNGRILMEKRELTTIDEERVYHEIRMINKRLHR